MYRIEYYEKKMWLPLNTKEFDSKEEAIELVTELNGRIPHEEARLLPSGGRYRYKKFKKKDRLHSDVAGSAKAVS